MSGIGFSELLILALIGLIVLGPKRLPQVANQIGGWVGQARRMTRVMKRQLEDELNLDSNMSLKMPPFTTPRDDDTYSPLHDDEPAQTIGGAAIDIRKGGVQPHSGAKTGTAADKEASSGVKTDTAVDTEASRGGEEPTGTSTGSTVDVEPHESESDSIGETDAAAETEAADNGKQKPE